MNPPSQFGSAKPARTGEGLTCAQCEAMLSDWMDNAIGGELSPVDRSAFELHIATCAECSQMLADAQRGAALLEMLKSPRPQPSSNLMDRILANTSGIAGPAKSRLPGVTSLATIDGSAVDSAGINPANYILSHTALQPRAEAPASNVLAFRVADANRFSVRAITHTMMQPRFISVRAITHTMMQPRFAMTAAMAFFSIALTLNLTGVHLNELSISDLKPSNIRRTFYQADASVARYYDNLRVVYELESRVQDMKRSNDGGNLDGNSTSGSGTKSDPDAGAVPAKSKDKSKQDQPKNVPKVGSGTSQRHSPMRQSFSLAYVQDLPFHADASKHSIFTGSAGCGTVVTNNKLKKETQEGVLA